MACSILPIAKQPAQSGWADSCAILVDRQNPEEYFSLKSLRSWLAGLKVLVSEPPWSWQKDEYLALLLRHASWAHS